MKNLSHWAYAIIPVILFITGSQQALAENPIKKLTSKESAQETKPVMASLKRSFSGGLKKHSIGLGIGQTFLIGDFSDLGDDSITADLLYNYSASHSFDLLAGIHYSSHDFERTSVSLLGATLGIKAKLFQFDEFSPFAVGGFGFYAPQVERITNNAIEKSERSLVFGYHLGVGADLRLNNLFTIGLLAQYHNPFDVKQDFGREVEGSYYKLLITTFYTFQ